MSTIIDEKIREDFKLLLDSFNRLGKYYPSVRDLGNMVQVGDYVEATYSNITLHGQKRYAIIKKISQYYLYGDWCCKTSNVVVTTAMLKSDVTKILKKGESLCLKKMT